LFAIVTVGVVSADDGQMFRRNVSKTPDQETHKAAMGMMKFYVPAQNSDGTLLDGIEYYDAEGALAETRTHAKPLVSIYIDDMAGHEELPSGMVGIMGGTTMGAHDAFAALSLDDGATWKRSNLSDAAHLSSFTLANGHEYPGDAASMTFKIAGNKVLAGWLSKYCSGGDALYTFTDEEKDALAAFMGLEPIRTDGPYVYLDDLFGVAGSQGSVDYTLQGWPEVGEIPYSCVWTARGTLEFDSETGLYDIVWRKAERLTSGRRDANRLEIAAAEDAGFVMVWQEDPQGLRPGQGLGPGEGWSGAIVNQKTDIWYSYIGWEEFGLVDDDGDLESVAPIPLAEYEGTTIPKPGIPMAIPVRLSDNNMCKAGIEEGTSGYQPYCYEDFDDDGTTEFCAESVSWTNPGGTPLDICQAEDGRVLWGRTGASRPRINLEGYDSDGDGETDSAWVIMGAEELKALGEGTADEDEDVEPIDIGKNIWYYSFDMFNPELVSQGGMINHPAKDPETGLTFEMLEDEWGNPFYETEISRRFNLMSQSIAKAQESDNGVLGVLFYKMGIINQGGPADIFLRRLVLPDEYDPQVDNPYAFENMYCENWEYTDGSNPKYVEGLCLDTGINVSATGIVQCDAGTAEYCVENFPWDGSEDITDKFPKVTEWEQTVDNLDDESWENPYDVSKGHRGFIDGDILMVMYAWSPNWKANSVGNDKYNLYIRRSFDGGATWTTTPASLGGDGTCTTENYLADVGEDGSVETCYGPGEFEQARNVSQFFGTKTTVLDPRYTPTIGSITKEMQEGEIVDTGTFMYPDDERDPSYFFIVYETGDNTTSAVGEATPMDLFYSRAYDYGDDYDEVEYTSSNTGETYFAWDWLEHDRDDLSGEASVTTNPGGTFFYAVWNQWQEDEHEVVSESDIIFRRVMYLDDGTTDAAPSTAILYVSHTMPQYGEDLVLVGSAWDNDHIDGMPYEDIAEMVWTDTFDGVTTVIDDGDGNPKTLNIPASNLPPGWHQFQFKACDKGGRWSPGVNVIIIVAEERTEYFLPMTLRP
jgi:hypothetical protein